jgi:hypothetical protein
MYLGSEIIVKVDTIAMLTSALVLNPLCAIYIIMYNVG